MDYNDFDEEMKEYEERFEEELRQNEDTIGDIFNAKIKEIREHNGITTWIGYNKLDKKDKDMLK